LFAIEDALNLRIFLAGCWTLLHTPIPHTVTPSTEIIPESANLITRTTTKILNKKRQWQVSHFHQNDPTVLVATAAAKKTLAASA